MATVTTTPNVVDTTTTKVDTVLINNKENESLETTTLPPPSTVEITPEETESQPKETIVNEAPNPVDAALSKPPILCLGAPRTGTASLCAALKILGYPNIHHGLDTMGPKYNYQWQIFNRAADATFPNLPTYTGKPFTRKDWDELMHEFDAITDVGSMYATSLTDAYPDAKVILVERDVEAWLKSIAPIYANWDDPAYEKRVLKFGPYSGTAAGLASLKFTMGWTGVEKATDISKNARTAYERHYRTIREKVPKELLLDYQLTQGWEPLCAFLGKPVPDVPFPRVNDSKAYKKWEKKVERKAFGQVMKNMILRRKIPHE